MSNLFPDRLNFFQSLKSPEKPFNLSLKLKLNLSLNNKKELLYKLNVL